MKQTIIETLASREAALAEYRTRAAQTTKDLATEAAVEIFESVLAGNITPGIQRISDAICSRHHLFATKMHGLQEVYIPLHALARAATRAGVQLANTATLGQETIQSGVSGDIAPFLFPFQRFLSLCTTLTGCKGNLFFVKLASNVNAGTGWVDETTDVMRLRAKTEGE
jgi:hypothetical protein